VRYVERTCRKLARTLFHKMVRHGAGLQRRQMLLFRGVDIGAELYAMAVTCARAQMFVRTGRAEAEQAVELAELFCRMARRRVADGFRGMADNDDPALYGTARRVLDGEHLWLEEGVAENQPVSLPAAEWNWPRETAAEDEAVPAVN
jgi:hypothetical protein